MDENEMKEFFETVKPHLNEKARRIVTAGAAMAAGQRSVSKISRASGMSREVIRAGIKEIQEGVQGTGSEAAERIRRPGGGRKKAIEHDPALLADLRGLIDPATRGDPESPLLWTSKSLRHLESELRAKGHEASHVTIRALLKSQGFSLQADYKMLDPGQHEDRDAQFLYIYSNIKEAQRLNQPVVSVDTYAEELTITADSGGSNGYCRKLWKRELQRFADETGLVLHILHFPPGTSKWNKIEHRMFSFISKNWKGKPLVSLEVIVSLIANTTTGAGLKIKCAVDINNYATGIKVTSEEMSGLFLVPDEYHGVWNYRLFPRIYDNAIY